MLGQTISHYTLLEELGAGGMGIVYRAEDTRLGRQVALKFLPAHLSTQRGSLQRFRQEARVASALNHPHICIIYDIDEHDGHPFIVMELLQGATLRDLIAGRPLPLERVVAFAAQIADALDAAHTRGIIHRDIKPANVFVGPRDQVKVLDFGVAKLMSERAAAVGSNGANATPSDPGFGITNPGVQLGTLAYMSPEQARGEPLDPRSDLFSLGAIVYEMATGQRAFPGTVPALLADSVLNREPVPAPELNALVPDELVEIIGKALAKDRARRYQSAGDLLADLRRLQRALSSAPHSPELSIRVSGPRGGASTERRRRTVIVASVGAALVAAGVLLVTRWHDPPVRDSVVLAEFANNTGDPVFDYTLRQGLAVQLGQSPFVSVVSDDRVRETLRLMGRPPEDRLTHATALEVCRRQGIKAMLEGSISTLGRVYVVALEATNCETGDAIAREQSEVQDKELVLRAVSRMASTMRRTLGESMASIKQFDAPLEQTTTQSLEALRAYTMAQRLRVAGQEIEAIPLLLRAIELDSGFASAYTVLSNAYSNLGEEERAKDYARKAYQRRASVSERERLFITYQYHDRVTGDQLKAIRALEVWKQSFPREFPPVNSLAFIDNVLGRFEQAVLEGEEAVRRNPSHGFPYSNLAQAYRGLGRFDDARRIAQRAVDLKIETLPTRRLLYLLAVVDGDSGAAARQLEWARGRTREFDMVGAQAQVAAYAGRLRDARQLYYQAMRMAQAANLGEVAIGYQARVGWMEAIYGNGDRASTIATQVLSHDTNDEARLVAASTLALSGAAADAERIADEVARANPEHTLINAVWVPIVRASVALARNEPRRAIEQLNIAGPYETGLAAALAPLYLRGQAFLLQGDAARASGEYQRILSHRGTDLFSPLHAVALLELARSQARAGDTTSSRRSYERFMDQWRHADAETTLLHEAQAEYDRLTP